jgi:Tfp pilus assembly protein PilX
VWWLLGLLAALAVTVIAVVTVRNQRARKAWEAQLAGAMAESTWLAHELLVAALSTESAAARQNLWVASRPRVAALVSRLNGLVASAPKDRSDRSVRLGWLRDAVIDVRSAMDADAATDAAGDRKSLGAARQAQRQLEQALLTLQPPDAVVGPRLD